MKKIIMLLVITGMMISCKKTTNTLEKDRTPMNTKVSAVSSTKEKNLAENLVSNNSINYSMASSHKTPEADYIDLNLIISDDDLIAMKQFIIRHGVKNASNPLSYDLTMYDRNKRAYQLHLYKLSYIEVQTKGAEKFILFVDYMSPTAVETTPEIAEQLSKGLDEIIKKTY